MLKPKIVLCGIQQQGKGIINFLDEHGIKVTHIVTISKETAFKNKSEGTWVSYEDLGIPIYYAKSYSFKHEDDIKFFEDNCFDILLLGGWQRLISEGILNTIKHGGLGQHGSPEFLPKGRGRSPLNWAIIQGKKRLIWNLFLLKPGVDNGDVIDYQFFEINDYDDCQTLYYKVKTSVKHMILRTIPKLLNGSISFIKQKGEPSFFPKRVPEDGKIDWAQSLYDINNLIRGVTKPYPGAFTCYREKNIFIWKAQIWDTMMDFYRDKKYGEIIEIFDNHFVIKCYDGLLLVTEHEDDDIFIGKKYE